MKKLPSLPAREKWQLFISGHDAGPMVSPLCDDWSLDVSYYWPYENEPEPFPAGHRYHALSQQMAMAKVCGWDPTFLCGADMPPRNPDIRPQSSCTGLPGGGTRNETVIQTPLGPLSCITETKSTTHVVKNWIETEEDLRRTTWLTRRQADFDESVAIAQGREARAAIGDKGVMGTWISPPVGNCMNHDMMFYHLADWPDAAKSCTKPRAASPSGRSKPSTGRGSTTSSIASTAPNGSRRISSANTYKTTRWRFSPAGERWAASSCGTVAAGSANS